MRKRKHRKPTKDFLQRTISLILMVNHNNAQNTSFPLFLFLVYFLVDLIYLKNYVKVHYSIFFFSIDTLDHRSTFCAAMLTGMALSSVLMQRNSPETHMRVTQTVLMTHQLRVLPRYPL